MPTTAKTNGMRTLKLTANRFPRRILVDTGIIIGYYDASDPHHDASVRLLGDWIVHPGPSQLVITFPVLYETLSTQFVKNQRRMTAWTTDWNGWHAMNRLEFCEDDPYRNDALTQCAAEVHRPPHHFRALSLVDRILRALLDDPTVHIDSLWTFNPGDFADVCKRRNISISP